MNKNKDKLIQNWNIEVKSDALSPMKRSYVSKIFLYEPKSTKAFEPAAQKQTLVNSQSQRFFGEDTKRKKVKVALGTNMKVSQSVLESKRVKER